MPHAYDEETIDFESARNDLSPLIESAIEQRKARIRAEVEAMDWPEFIDG